MKIVRVINSLGIGGAERSIANNVPLHIDNGIEMDVLLLNGVETHFLKELKKQNVNVFSLGINNNIYNPFLVFKICRYVKNYDIIHVHLFPALYWVALAKILTNSKSKFVFTEHDTHNKRRGNFIFKYIDKFIYKQYDTVITISDAANKNLLEHVDNSIKTTVVYNGVDLHKVEQEALEINNDFLTKVQGYKVLLQIAGFRKQKDQDTVIKSLLLLPKDYCACFIGDGERKQLCFDLAKKLGVADRVFFLGIQDKIGSFIKRADIIVMSSFWEGFGRAAVEGMALRKPLIASNVSGLADVVNDAGLLFTVGDSEELSKLTLKLMSNPHYYEDIANKCYERSKKFDILFMINGYEKIYKALNQ